MKSFFFIACTFFTCISFAQTEVNWINLTEYCEATPNGIKKFSGGSSWNTGARSEEVLPVGQDGYVEWTIDALNSNYILGLGETDLDGNWTSLSYAVMVQNSQLNYIESGKVGIKFGTAVLGSKLRIERVGSEIVFLLDGVERRRIPDSTTNDLFVDCSIKYIDSEVNNVVVDFGEKSGGCCTTMDKDLTLEADLIVGNAKADGYRVSVDGKIICEELRVEYTKDWPDYVFTPDYQLMSLKELKAFIQTYGHLPKVPSTESVRNEGGHDVGDMQKMLLEKIEELTLYTLQLEERIAELEKD